LKTARGQIDGIIKMVEEDRYCIDISNQLMASKAVLNSCNKVVLKAHMNSCVKEAIENDDAEVKIEELISIIDRLAK